MKFMVDDFGPEGMRAEVERRLGYALPDFPLPPLDGQFADHVGVQPQKQDGLTRDRRSRAPRARHGRAAARARRAPRGARRRGARHASAELRARERPDAARRRRPSPASRALGLPLDTNPIRGGSIACTGEPHCNFSVTETKTRLDSLVDALEAALRRRRRAAPAAPRRLPARLRAALGRRPRLPGHDRARRGGQAPAGLRRLPPRRARPAGRDRPPRLPTRPDAGARRARGGPVAGWLEQRVDGEDFRSFCDRVDDDELGVLAGREPAKARVREEAAA